MKKIKNILKKITFILVIFIFNLFNFINSINAVNVSTADIKSIGDCGDLLIYKGIVVKAYYAQYENDGISYPAYCLDKTKQGVSDELSYSVSVQDAINDIGLWRVIINGYPYKTIDELGVANKEEAFTATKQAIYCYLHENKPEDYEPIGEAGVRTLNALTNIYNNSLNSTETKISNTISIHPDSSSWIQDNLKSNYISKTYSINSQAQISSYNISFSSDNLNDIQLVDEKNNPKSEFNSGEKFKILIPLKSATKDSKIKITVNSKLKTKPVLYGSAPDSNYQDYALTAATYEDGTCSIEDTVLKNKTKITILKTDSENNLKLEGVEFSLLDSNKKLVKEHLITDKDGKITIDNIIPGTYYLKEVKSLDGYIIQDDLIEISTIFNQETTVKVDNSKEKKPVIETPNQEIPIKKLPVTGM